MVSSTLAQTIWPRPTSAPLAALGRDALLVTAFSLLNALCAQIFFLLPGTPIPVTGQTFGVLLTGALLGPRLGALSLMLYLIEGAAGLPFFFGGTFGLAHILGPTGGYLLSYPLAAGLIGWLAGRGWDRKPLLMLAAMLLGSAVIYAFGASQLAHYVGHAKAISGGVLPFLPGDALKALLAAGLLPAGWKLLGQKRG